MPKSIIRTDRWPLQATEVQKNYVALTLGEYRAYCKALSIVVLNNWPALSRAPSFAAAVERLVHPTSANPAPRHTYFARRFYKFPSYLRRAAIEFVKGQASSYLTRYDQWQTGDRKRPGAGPPRFSAESGCYPALYRGQLVKFDDEYGTAEIKLWDGREWLWHSIPIKAKRRRHLQGAWKSPLLVRSGKEVHLSMPFSLKPEAIKITDADGNSLPVCAIDVGINTLATASVVSPGGTVAARRFFHPGADIDRRNKRADLIRRKARKTGNLSKGFCRSLHRKPRHINEEIAQKTSRHIVDWAVGQGVGVIVLENLKGWRPRGGRRRSALKQRFHGWLHRRLTDLIQMKFEEVGGKVECVHPRGTSQWAFDGSGKVTRNATQYEIATFASGKCYNADLNASYNIGARYWAWKLKLTHRKDGQVPHGKSSCGTPRMPVTLSTLWKHRQEPEAPHLCVA